MTALSNPDPLNRTTTDSQKELRVVVTFTGEDAEEVLRFANNSNLTLPDYVRVLALKTLLRKRYGEKAIMDTEEKSRMGRIFSGEKDSFSQFPSL